MKDQTCLAFGINLTIETIMIFWPFFLGSSFSMVLCYQYYSSKVALLILVITILGLLYQIQDSLLYFPEQPPDSRLYVDSPSRHNLPAETVWIHTGDGVRLNAYLIKQHVNSESVPTLVYLHGNAGNIGHRLVSAALLFRHCKVNILLLDYRGYGFSHGSISESGLLLDAEAAVDYLLNRKDIDPGSIIIFGRSLGGAIALALAASSSAQSSRIAAVIVENTFTSIKEMAKTIFPIPEIDLIPDWAYKNKYESILMVPSISVPTLFISGLSDQLIPPRMMSDLFQACGSQYKRMATFENGTHNDTWQALGYYEAIESFLIFLRSLSLNGPYSADNKPHSSRPSQSHRPVYNL